GAAMLAFALADALLDYLGNHLVLQAGQRMVSALRRDVFAHLLVLPLSWHRRRRGGDVMTRLSEDVGRVQDLVVVVGTGLLPHVLTVLGILGMMAAIDWRYGLMVAAVIPALALVSDRWSRKLRARVRDARHEDGELWSMAQETLAAIPLVQAHGREPYEARRFARLARRSLGRALTATRTQAELPPLINFMVGIATAAITTYGAARVLDGSLTAGDLLLFLAYLRGLVTPVRQMTKNGPVMGRAVVAIERIRELLNEKVAIADPEFPVEAPPGAGRLEFRSVSFSYGADAAALEHVSFHLAPGRRVALVGPTGAGKSTIAALAARLADPTDGSVFLDGRDLRSLRLQHVRRRVALMLQDAPLLHGTVWENIAYGRPGAGRDAAIDAAIAADVDEILSNLPDGYDTVVAERGASLSGGQRQCVAIARATLADADVVILDEPSSSLDATTERRISTALARLTASRASLIIAHRLNTVRGADEILVLERGRIVQRGDHATLLREGGVYAGLLRSQSGGGLAA
ncbi:MAG: ABC transporter ATP-binding protein, partial [Pseudomonadota bacterium]|nr:ABC transporter ATP-binding protein [Pseudomonadota bacterium]